jgi:hypothetical protein
MDTISRNGEENLTASTHSLDGINAVIFCLVNYKIEIVHKVIQM